MGLFLRDVERRQMTAEDVMASINATRLSGGGERISVDESTAMRHAAVWACVRLIAGVISTFPIDQQRTVRGETVEVPPSSLWSSPAPELSLPTWLYQLVVSGLLDGNLYGLVTGHGADTYPSTVEPVDPGRVSWRQSESGAWESVIDGQSLSRWPLGPLWHVPLFGRAGQPFGQSPIRAAAETIGGGLAAERFGNQFFTGGGNPNALLRAKNGDPTSEQAAGVKKAFQLASAGRGVAVLGADWDYERIQVDPDDSQFIDSQRFTVEQVARIYGVPPEMIGGATSGSSVTYANREQRASDWLTFGLMPYLVPLEAGLSQLIPRGQRVRFNVNALLRSDLKTRYEAYQIGIGSGFLEADEARGWEDLPPLTTSGADDE